MRRHQPTIRHSEGVAEMLTIAAEKINKKHGRKVVDPQMARYAGLLHDIGKLFLNPNLILDIARRLEDFEMKEVRQHVNNGLEFLRVLIGFQHFSELVSLIGAHHVQYGNDKGYPTDAQGDSIKGLPKMISEELKIPEDHEDYMAKELDPAHALLARLLTVIDVMSAVRSWDRFYREGPTPIKDFVDSLISRAGNDYDPEAIILVFELFNEGAFNNALCHTGADREVLEKAQVFDKLYGWGDVAKFINHYQDEFEKIFGVQLDELKGRFMGGIKPNLKMTRETIGREICEVMINSSEDEDAARDRYKRLQGYLMVRFDDWFATIE